jgi:two-component system phosphate regulon sensor histidine kinase PhoR
VDEAVDREMVAVGPMIADVVEAAQNAAQGKGIKLTADIESDLPSISAVRNQVKQLFAVLVDNAVKYTPARGSVEVTAEREGRELRVAVKDTGIGIPPEDRDKIFGEFYRSANARSQERQGTGLGLTIAEQIAKDLGGTIEVESTVGGGSTFTVVIPVPETAT